MAAAGQNGREQANINSSRSVSFSLIDANGTEIPMKDLSEEISVIIPRDPNIIMPEMALQNVTALNTGANLANNNRQFALYYVNVTSSGENITVAATFELKSENSALAYLIVYRFDAIPVLNSTLNETDGFRVLCPLGNFFLLKFVYPYQHNLMILEF